MSYYVYEYLREDNTPYYVGKGTKDRAFKKQGHTVPLPPKDRIRFVAENLTDQEARDLEISLIAKYGRKDLGTGILRNMTDGGEGSPGRITTKETKEKLSKLNLGKKQSEETKTKRAESLRGQKRTDDQRKTQSEAALKRWSQQDPIVEKIRRLKIQEARKNQIIKTIQITCPHCGKTGGNRIMPRYHFNNCKFK
jgi:hypothetical protein